MAPSAVEKLKNRIKKHQKHMEQFKVLNERNDQTSKEFAECLKLVQKALQDIDAEKENAGSNPVDVRVLTSTFNNLQM